MNDSFSGREENDRRNYFMINLHRDICSDPKTFVKICINISAEFRVNVENKSKFEGK